MDRKTHLKLSGKVYRPDTKYALDDINIDYKTAEEFALFDKVAEGLMRLVFEEALSQGFFGMFSDAKSCRILLT